MIHTEEEQDLLKQAASRALQTFVPAPRMPLSEFANQNLYLSADYSEKVGMYRWQNRPFQRAILDTIGSREYENVVLATCAQSGKSVILLATLLYSLKYKPQPALLMQATLQEAQKFSRRRLIPMMRDCGLRGTEKKRDGTDTCLEQSLSNGASVTLVGANSPAGLRGLSASLLLCDEVSGYSAEAGNEGSPTGLAETRLQGFVNKKKVFVSTPLEEDGEIWTRYQNSDQRHYHIQCQECGNHFEPLIEHLHCESDENDKPKPETSKIFCPSCGVGMGEKERKTAIDNGKWVAANPGHRVAGFNLNAFSCINVKLADIKRHEIKGQYDFKVKKELYNLKLGLPYKADAITAGDNFAFMDRVEDFDEQTVPVGVAFVSSGVDIQRSRIEITKMGHGENNEKWVISHKVFAGDVTQPDVWQALKDEILTPCMRVDGLPLRTLITAVDSGDGVTVQNVYDFCNANRKHNVFATKGNSIYGRPIWPKTVSVSDKGKVYMVATDVCKDLIYQHLKIEQQGAGYIHFSNTLTPDYFKQLTNEEKRRYEVRGRTYWKWVALGRNEALDTAALAWAAAVGSGLNPTMVQKRNQKRTKQNEPQQELIIKDLPESKEVPNEAQPSDPIIVNKPAQPQPVQQVPQQQPVRQQTPIKQRPKFSRPANTGW